MNFKDYVLKTPTSVEALKNDSQKINHQKFNKIVLLGVGSSLTACQVVERIFEVVTSENKTIAKNTAEFLNYDQVNEDTLYLVVSQSGRSAVAIKAYEKIIKKTANCIFITAKHEKNDASSYPLHYELQMELETVGFKSLGYTITVFSLLKWLGIDLTKDFKSSEILNWIQKTEIKILKDLNQVQGIKKINFIGDYYSYQIFQEGGLKVIEMLNIDYSVSEIEDYIHCRYLDTNTDAVIVINSFKQTTNKVNIIKFLNSVKNNVIFDLNNDVDITKPLGEIVLKQIIFIQLLVAEITKQKKMSLITIEPDKLKLAETSKV